MPEGMALPLVVPQPCCFLVLLRRTEMSKKTKRRVASEGENETIETTYTQLVRKLLSSSLPNELVDLVQESQLPSLRFAIGVSSNSGIVLSNNQTTATKRGCPKKRPWYSAILSDKPLQTLVAPSLKTIRWRVRIGSAPTYVGVAIPMQKPTDEEPADYDSKYIWAINNRRIYHDSEWSDCVGEWFRAVVSVQFALSLSSGVLQVGINDEPMVLMGIIPSEQLPKVYAYVCFTVDECPYSATIEQI